MENQIFELQYALDTFYLLICGVLVMWMMAGFSMLEAGLVRAKNTTEILTKNISLFAVACILYMICGYHFMWDGGFFLQNVETTAGVDAAAALATKAEQGFGGDSVSAGAANFFFQAVFVATAMSIVSGAVAERMKLWVFLAFAVVMTGVIYPLEGSWTWGDKPVFGLFDLHDYIDVAGSGVVHVAGAMAALIGVLILGPRKGKYSADGAVHALPGANLPLATLGALILWLGWFGFNGGSVLKMSSIVSANEVANVIMNTNTAAAGGLLAALITARLLFGKADLTLALNGILAGLVAISADPASPNILMATVIGAIGGTLVVFGILGLEKCKIDDPVGAIAVHGVAGVWGVLAVSFTNPDASLFGQLIGLLTIMIWVSATSLAVWMALEMLVGLRVSDEEESLGLDIGECGLEAYPEFHSTSD